MQQAVGRWASLRGMRSPLSALRALAAVLLVAVIAAVVACNGDEDGTPGVSPTAAQTAAAEVTLTPSPSPEGSPVASPTPEAREVLETLWLVDASDGSVLLLTETEGYVGQERFVDAGQAVAFTQVVPGQGSAVHALDLSGHPWDSPREPQSPGVCERLSCGPSSPDGRHTVYTTSPPEGSLVYAYGVIDLETGSQLELRGDLVHCGGCDARYAPAWSPSGRYFTIAEFGGDGRVFLADVEARTDRPIGTGNETTRRPDWSPVADIVALSGVEGTALVHPVTGDEWPIDLEWPVRWDASGRYLYSPAWGSGGVTRIFDMETGETDEVAGTPPQAHLWTDDVAVVGLEDGGYTAALGRASGCDGVRVTSALAPSPQCIAGATGAAVSPDGRRVAAAVFVEPVRVERTAQRWPTDMALLRLLIMDVTTGAIVQVEGELVGFAGEPPAMRWHPESTHLLVRWPASYGL